MNHNIGVLALQGAFAAHAECLVAVGASPREVRKPADLVGLDGLLLPGGESSTMSQLLDSSGLFDSITQLLGAGMPVLGTCAGLILLSSEILDGRADQRCFGAIDVSVRRNAYGRQVDSFETDLETSLGSMRAVFIRAPRIERVGDGVEVLADREGEPVLVRQGSVLGATFHPELSGSTIVHEYFVRLTAKGTV